MASLNSNVLVRIPSDLRDAYTLVCKKRGVSVSDDIRAYIHLVVSNALMIPASKTPHIDHFELLPSQPSSDIKPTQKALSVANTAIAARSARKKKSKK